MRTCHNWVQPHWYWSPLPITPPPHSPTADTSRKPNLPITTTKHLALLRLSPRHTHSPSLPEQTRSLSRALVRAPPPLPPASLGPLSGLGSVFVGSTSGAMAAGRSGLLVYIPPSAAAREARRLPLPGRGRHRAVPGRAINIIVRLGAARGVVRCARGSPRRRQGRVFGVSVRPPGSAVIATAAW